MPLLENHPAINRHTQRALHDTQTGTHDTADSAVVDAECSFLLQRGRPVQSDSDWAAWTDERRLGLAGHELMLPSCAAMWVQMALQLVPLLMLV